MERTLHHTLLLMEPYQLKALKEWARDETDYDRYMRKVETRKERMEYWNGRLQIAQLIRSEADLCFDIARERNHNLAVRESEKSGK